MAKLPTQTFTQLVQNQVAAIQGAAAGLIDFTVGSIMRAVVEAFSQTVLWLQGLILALLNTTRLATSSGADVDSWGADYGFFREQAVAASGSEIFGRFSGAIQGIVPIGSTVETQDGSQQYVVAIDTTNSAYSAALDGYVMPPGVLTITVPIQATVVGSAANAVAGAINTITGSIPGIDYCSNPLTFDNGVNAETDAAFKARFVAFINSLSRATKAAINLAVTSVGLNVTCSILENETYMLTPQPGFFAVVVNDGTGSPPSTLLSAVGTAVEAVRGLCIQYGIFPPLIIDASVSMSVGVGVGYDQTTVLTAVTTAIETYMAGLSLNQGMNWTRLAQLAYDASPGVVEVSNIRLNGGAADIPPDPRSVIELISISVAPL